jgi:hypothetical protein
MAKRMSALESMIASHPRGEAPVDPMLAYELPAPSTAVVERKQHCRAYPSSASTLSHTGTRTVRIRLGGEGFIDPSSVRLQYTIVNGEATKWMRPYTGPWGVWGTVRLLSGGSEIDHYVVNFDEILKRNNAAEYSTSTSKASPRAPLYPSTMIFDENDTLGIPMSQRPSKQGVYSNNYYQMAVAAPSKKRSISVQKPFVT